jgi:hypothetical protein
MRGGDTSGLRAYNERLIISAIRAGGAMSKAEIARATGLSVQAARVIVDALIDGETLLKLPKIRGLVGQPSTPIALNPAGAYSVGVKIGRRSLEVVLVDMMGDVVRKARMRQSVPLPAQTLQAVCAMVQGLLADAPRGARAGSRPFHANGRRCWGACRVERSGSRARLARGHGHSCAGHQ